jgi:hypothetical protein
LTSHAIRVRNESENDAKQVPSGSPLPVFTDQSDDHTVVPKKMNPLRLQLAIIMVLWVVAEGWFAYYWWPTKYFSQAFPSIGIPITAMAIVLMVWAFLRSYAIRLASESSQGKGFGIALLFAASVLGGFAPYLIGRILADNNIFRSSFHGEAGWPAAICSISLWWIGAIYFIVGLVEMIFPNYNPKLVSKERRRG